MKYITIYLFIICCHAYKAQVRFNINEPISIDTTQDPGTKVIQTKTKHYVICGISTFSPNNYFAAKLAKTDSLGNCIWKRQYDFSPATTFTNNGLDFFRDIIELPDSNYLLLGITTNTATNDDDIFLCKIDTGGNIMWFKKYMHPDNDESNAFKLTPDGKIIIVGYTFSNGGTQDDVVLIKTDIDGNLMWRKRFGNAINWEKYYTIDVIKNNTEYILGGEYGYYNTGTPYFDMSIMRTDTAGNPLWQQEYGIVNFNENGFGGSVTLDSGYVLCGDYNGTAAILKVDKHGVQEWVKNYSSESPSHIVQVKQLPDSNYIMITTDNDWNNNNATGYLIKANKNGDMLWKRVYPHPTPSIGNYFFGFNTTADGGFIITGQYNHIGQPYQNTWLVKTDSLGCDSAGGCSYLPTIIQEQSFKSEVINVWPNPADDVLNISFSHSELVSESQQMLKRVQHDVTIKITDTLGKVVLQETTNSNNFALKTNNLLSGIYFISIYTKHKLIGTKKFIKE